MNVFHAQGAYQAKSAALTHNDPLYRVQPAAREWRLADLHQIATGRRVRVAVIDSMVERTHPDLAGQVAISENFVQGQSDAPEQHGTGVAGVIAARADNGVGIAGVAPGARLMALRACWQEPAAAQRPTQTICDSLALAKALQFAVGHDAQVINLSLSGPQDILLGKLLDLALVRGTAVVSAYDRDLPRGGFPASHPGVVAVVDGGSGPPITGVLSAPGRDVPTTQPGGRWYFVNGASYAAAHVSGLFALLRERSAQQRGLSALVVARSDGSIDTCSTLLRASGPCDCACARASVLSAKPRP
jgi:subtilisin family serine protease